MKKKKILWAAGLWLMVVAWCVMAAAQGGSGRKIVCSAFVPYDWCMEILGDRAGEWDVQILANSGDLHNFQPSARNIMDTAACDLFICVGGESDEGWLSALLHTANNEEMTVIRMVDGVEGRKVPDVQGAHGDHAHHEEQIDEHVWMSLRNAQAICGLICDSICALDPEHAPAYRQNEKDYAEKLNALDEQYAQMTRAAQRDTILVADRFPFVYLAGDYDIAYYAAFSGCSAESEASFETLAFLIGKARELELDVILVDKGSDREIAKTIAASLKGKDVDILELDSMQAVGSAQVSDGADYYESMKNNLAVLQKALGAPDGR